jgi:hypothetical protein
MEPQALIQRFGNRPSGEIVRTQTTYIDIVLRSPEGDGISEEEEEEEFRIHYDRKQEFNLSLGKFSSIFLETAHPLLIDYLEPNYRVDLGCYVEDKTKFRSILQSVTIEIFDGWRSFESYLNMPLDEFLRERYGILMFAPRTFATKVVEESGTVGIKLYAIPISLPTSSPEVLIFDRSYVIANGFKVEPL